jgi:hypothetical protein
MAHVQGLIVVCGEMCQGVTERPVTPIVTDAAVQGLAAGMCIAQRSRTRLCVDGDNHTHRHFTDTPVMVQQQISTATPLAGQRLARCCTSARSRLHPHLSA